MSVTLLAANNAAKAMEDGDVGSVRDGGYNCKAMKKFLQDCIYPYAY